jgi:hypothetical protein
MDYLNASALAYLEKTTNTGLSPDYIFCKCVCSQYIWEIGEARNMQALLSHARTLRYPTIRHEALE